MLISCTSSINKDNFDRIEPGMTFQQVVTLLGKPNSSSSLSIGEITGTTARWEHRNAKITIQFFNGVVKLKTYFDGVTTPRED